MPNAEFDRTMMLRAIALAKQGAGYVSPNPLVGCVIVSANAEIIGEGYHKKYGEAHAEVNAVADAEVKGHTVEGSTVYVTLEPCAHTGKTPPCADLLIAKKIARCVIAVQDPYSEVNGKGIEKLQQSGIEVILGVCEEEAHEVNRFFLHAETSGRPYITLKIASSLDGKVALKSGKSQWITSEASRALVHQMRSEYDAVMVASATVIADDPTLTVRHVEGRNPKRIILDASLRVPESAKVVSDEFTSSTIILASDGAIKDKSAKVQSLEARGVKVLPIRTTSGQFDLQEAFFALRKSGITSILVEPGPTLATSFYQSGLFDEIALFLAPMVLGDDARSAFGELHISALGSAEKLSLHSVKHIERSDDILITYRKN